MSEPISGILQPVDDTDPRVEYYPPQAWTPVEHSTALWGAQNSTYHTSAANGSFIFLQFHGMHLRTLLLPFCVKRVHSQRFYLLVTPGP